MRSLLGCASQQPISFRGAFSAAHLTHPAASRRMLFFFFKQKTAYEIRKGDWSSDVCSSDLAGTALPDGPPRTAARIGRPVEEPPPRSSSSALSVVPRGTSTIPGRLTWPERPKSLVPPPPPRLANQAPPSATMDGTAQSVSTLLMTVGLPQSPDSTGKGGRVRGIAR